MATHHELGKEGEDMAAKWLEERGYKILHRNWRHMWYEIDIVAQKDDVLHIIEVKARKYSRYGWPENGVTKRKFKRLQKATNEFLFLNPGYKWVQYDIISITVFKYDEPEYFFLQDVYL